jgi:hypothetical protein
VNLKLNNCWLFSFDFVPLPSGDSDLHRNDGFIWFLDFVFY